MAAKTSSKPKVKARARKPERALTASAKNIDLDRNAVSYIRKRRKPWQEQAWIYYDEVGEVKYAMNYKANSLSKIRMYAAEINPDPGKDPIATENEAANDAMDRLDQGEGISQILRDLAVNLSVPGECYLVGLAEREATDKTPIRPEEWSIRSTDEVSTTGDRVAIQNPGEKITLEKQDFFARFWMSHPRNGNDADSSLRGVLASCEEITMIERALRAVLRSRGGSAGILFLNKGLSLARGPDVTSDDSDGEARTDNFTDDLEEAILAPIANPESAGAVAPIVVQGDSEQIGKDKNWLLTFDRPLDSLYDTRMTRAIQRLAQGLDVPVEVVLGLGDTNHWSAWQITEDAFRAHIEPLMLAICQMFTTAFLQPLLRAQGVVDPERYVVWYDATKLVVRPDRGKDAQDAHDAIAISDEAYRAAKGFDEDDAPSQEEMARRLVLKGTRMDPTIQGQLLKKTIDPSIEVPEPQGGVLNPSSKQPPAQPTPTGPPNKGAPPTGPGVTAAAHVNIGMRLGAIDRALRQRLHVAADEALHRTLERAGNRIISRARRDQHAKALLEHVDVKRAASVLGPQMVASFGIDESSLVEGSFATLKRKFNLWVRQAQRQAVEIIGAPEESLPAITAQQDADRSEAWAWMSAALGTLAHDMLYDATSHVPDQGEFDESADVPFGLVRQAVARAGGADGMETTSGFGVSINGGTEPAGGVATGQLVMGLLGEQGQGVEGWVWVYGDFPRTRPFEPHEALDGVEFATWDDPVLTNDGDFPDQPLFSIGDHPGCVCDADPIIIAAEQSDTPTLDDGSPEEAA